MCGLVTGLTRPGLWGMAAGKGTPSFTGSRTLSCTRSVGQPGPGPAPGQRGGPESTLDPRGLAWVHPGQGEPQHPISGAEGCPPAGPRQDAEHSGALFQPPPSIAGRADAL